jgi:4-deoxy-L-threo-5-hexosulose-uronate ketol-isomerase
MDSIEAHDIRSYSRMSAPQLKRSFVVSGLFVPGRVVLRHWETDRTVLGGASPLGRALELEAPAWLKAEHFNDRRELGIVNIGGTGKVTVDGRRFQLGKLD